MEKYITAESKLTSKQFVQFARYNTYRRGKRLNAPLLFMVILLVSAFICSTHENGMLLTIVLSVVGIGLPLVYVLQFELSLRKQCKLMELDGQKIAYTLRFSNQSINVKANNGKCDYGWDAMNEAYRNGDCIYLYTKQGNAFLIPDSNDYSSDEIWNLIVIKLNNSKVLK